MERIQGDDVAAGLFGVGKDGFTEGVPGSAAATAVTAKFLNDVQEEIALIIEEAGLSLDATKRLSAAIKQVVANTQPRNVISPSPIIAPQNAYNPMGWSTAAVVRLRGGGSGFPLQGMTPSTQKLLVNANAVGLKSIYISHESGSASAADRVVMPTESSIRIAPGESLLVQYDETTARWRPVLSPQPSKRHRRRFPASRGCALKDPLRWTPEAPKVGAFQYSGTAGTWGISLEDIVPRGAWVNEVRVFYDRSSGTCALRFWKINLRGDFSSPMETDVAMSGSGTDLNQTMTVSPGEIFDTEDYYYFVVVDVTTATDLVVHGFEITWTVP